MTKARWRKQLATAWFACLSLTLHVPCFAQAMLNVIDDNGAQISIAKPAKRVISLAPHTTELIYAAGGGAQLVGAVAYSDYPKSARALPRVGDNRALDLERMLALKPDLIVAWRTGNTQSQLEALRSLQIPIFLSEPRTLDDVATNLERLGILLGTRTTAYTAAAAFRAQIEALRQRFAQRAPVRVFYQIWDSPLITLNSAHIVNDIILLCGARNIFAELPPLAPTVSTEAVLAARPQAIIATQAHLMQQGELPASLVRWRAWSSLSAVEHDNLFVLESDLIDRAGPRLVKGAAKMCESIEMARRRLAEEQSLEK